MSTRIVRLTLALLLVAAMVVGCDGGTVTPTSNTDTPPAEESTTPPDESAETELNTPSPLVIYLMRDDEKLHPVRRDVAGTRVGSGVLEALLEGPSDEEQSGGSTSSIPTGTRLLDVSIDSGVATVDLSTEFGTGGGSLSMMSRIAQVVFTATQFPTVDSVLFKMAGEPIDALGGEGIILEGPQTRAQWEDFAPAILVETPARGDTVAMGDALRISGSANVFEARFTIEVTDGDGLILLTEPVMATSGTGTRGTFDVTVTPTGGKPGFGAVIVSYSSPKDGARVVVDEIPLVFE